MYYFIPQCKVIMPSQYRDCGWIFIALDHSLDFLDICVLLFKSSVGRKKEKKKVPSGKCVGPKQIMVQKSNLIKEEESVITGGCL